MDQGFSRSIPQEYKSHLIKNSQNFGRYLKIYQEIFKEVIPNINEFEEDFDVFFSSKFIFDIFGHKVLFEKINNKKML